MFPQFWYFAEVWLSSPKEAQPWLVLSWLYWRHQEEIAYRRFLHHPIQEIERILMAYIFRTEVRPLICSAVLGAKKDRKATDGLRFFHIYINQDEDQFGKLRGFVHEILHVVCLEFGATAPDEARLDSIAEMVVKRNRKKIERIFNDAVYPG